MENLNVIERIAEEVRSIYNIKVPIHNIQEVIKSMGGYIIYNSCVADSYIMKSGIDTFIVTINKDIKNKNIVVGCLIGYLVLVMGFQVEPKAWKLLKPFCPFNINNISIRNIAYEFSMAFNMPEDEYKKQLCISMKKNNNTVNIEEIAKYFNVTVNEAYYRGKVLNYWV